MRGPACEGRSFSYDCDNQTSDQMCYRGYNGAMYTEDELAARAEARRLARIEERRREELRVLTRMVGYDEFTHWNVFHEFHMNWSYMNNMVRGWWLSGLTERLGNDGQWHRFRPEFLPLRRHKRLWTHESRYRWIDEPV